MRMKNRMKFEYKGQFFYIRSGPEYQQDLPGEEWIGIWRNIDETRRIEIVYSSQITEINLFPDLWEVHLYIRGRKTAKQYKFPDDATYQKCIEVLQSALSFDLT
jgi:hypothetical protein